MQKYGGTSSTFVFRLNLMYQCIKHDTDNMSTATLGDKTNISRKCWIFNVICRGSFCMFNDLRRGVLADFVDIGGIVDITVYTFLHNTGIAMQQCNDIQIMICLRHNIQQPCNDIQVMTCLRHNMTTTM